jgi:hypothetical protein
MKTYNYVDNNQGGLVNGLWHAPTIFACQADSILEADELFKNQMGIDVTRAKHIGVEIHV